MLIALICSLQIANARLTINITQGISQQIPIAIFPFQGIQTNSLQTPDSIGAVIASDLTNSGRFKTQTGNFPQSINNYRDIDWRKWSNDYIVLGSITSNSNDTYHIKYQLISKLNNVIVSSREYNNVNTAQLQSVAHSISNFIYQSITGNKGYFNSKIAYVDVKNPYQNQKSIYELIVADYDGYNPHVIIKQTKEPIMSPVWSKDGNKISYVSYADGKMAIYIIDVYSGKLKKVANYKGINSSPSFSPNDTTLAMALSQGYSEQTNIYLMNLNNDKLYKKLTLNGINTAPSFSPSGNEIVFVSDRGGSPQIYTTQVNSKYPESQRLTFDAKQAFDPQYTPNGQDIVFMYQKESGSGTQIAKINLRSKKITVLTHGKLDSSPSISPDGNMIIYAQGHTSGGANLAMVSIDGKVQITLPSNAKGAVQSPTWSTAI